MSEAPLPTSEPIRLNLALIPAKGLLDYRFDVTEISCRAGKLLWVSDTEIGDEFEVPGTISHDWELRSNEDSADSQWVLSNHGANLILNEVDSIATGAVEVVQLPCQLQMGNLLLELYPSHAPEHLASDYAHLARSVGDRSEHRVHALGRAPSSVTLAQWFDALGKLHRAGDSLPEFYDRAADALLEPGGMDAGLILHKDRAHWRVVGARVPHPERGVPIYVEILESMAASGSTAFHESIRGEGDHEKQSYPLAVAAPIFDSQGQVSGAVYGLRTFHRRNQRRGVRPLEAFFVQQTANAVTTEMIRREHERELARQSILLEQAFPDALVASLLNDPQILQGHHRELTVMFCDIRDFTQICERLPNEAVYQLLSQIMDMLTDCIREEMGVVIDYFGDGVAAFWNAPFDQPDHAELACQAASNMLHGLEKLNQDWESILGHPIKIGVGIHSGEALVGNSGSRFRIKYGPRGQTVNLAKRIESATKHLGLPLLVGEETASNLSKSFRARRVCRTRLPGSSQIVSLFEPVTTSQFESRRFEFAAYENALALFEESNYDGCCEMLEPLLDEGSPKDALAESLYQQATCRRDGNFDRRRSDDCIDFTPLPKIEENRA